jgi:hypothetical protein
MPSGCTVRAGLFKFQEYDVIDAAKAPLPLKVIENTEGLSWTAWVGAAGMPGKVRCQLLSVKWRERMLIWLFFFGRLSSSCTDCVLFVLSSLA